jgi:hypothetical protein
MDPSIIVEIPFIEKTQRRYVLDMDLMASLMKRPFDTHPEAASYIKDGLRAAHVRNVLLALGTIGSKVSKGKRDASMLGGEGAAFHNLIYHLVGGADAELRPPPREVGP